MNGTIEVKTTPNAQAWIDSVLEEPKLQIAQEYIDTILALLEDIRVSKWSLGDLMVELVDAHDGSFKRSEVISYIAGSVNVAYGALDEYERTSRRWPIDKRYPHLSWSIYRNATADDQDLLDRAADENWNSTRFKEEKFPGMQDPIKIISSMMNAGHKLLKQDNDIANSVLERLEEILDELEEIRDELEV